MQLFLISLRTIPRTVIDNDSHLEVLARDASRQQIEQLVLDLRDLVRPNQELQHFLELVQEYNLFAGALPWPEPDQALEHREKWQKQVDCHILRK